MSNSDFRAHLVFLFRIVLYFVALGAFLFALFQFTPQTFQAVSAEERGGEITQTFIDGLLDSSGQPPSLVRESAGDRIAVLGVLAFFFMGTIALMLPITWVYMHTHPRSYSRSLVTALLILPICATATVWLIQDSLPLAFGLAALVAAVRFRIRLDNPLDGVYVFASISVGLASGVAHIGVGYVMALFFCVCATMAWMFRYGSRPREPEANARAAAEGVDVHDRNSPAQSS